MSVYRYINNTATDLEIEGFLVRAYDELLSSVDIPVLTALVDGIDFMGMKDGVSVQLTDVQVIEPANIEILTDTKLKEVPAE